MSDSTEMRMNVIVCGRKLGTASGWDQADNFAISFSDYQPSVDLPAGNLFVDFDNGKLTVNTDEGEDLWSGDLVDFLSRIEPIK